MTTGLLALLDLERLDQNTFRDPALHVGTARESQRTFGGQVLAQALMAASRTVSNDRRAHSLHAYFLEPGSNASPIDYTVEHTRDGRTLSARRVLAHQSGRLLFTLTASFHIVEDGLEHSDPMPPGVPDAEECPLFADVLRRRFGDAVAGWVEWHGLEVRYAGDSLRQIPSNAHSAHMRVWARAAEALPEDHRVHQAIAAYLSDLTILSVATIPHKVPLISPNVRAASIDHAMWFHRGLRADQWLLHDQISPSASGAMGFSTGRIFQDGTLRASLGQEGLVRVRSAQQ